MMRLRIPATSANLGAGFDALGLALGLYNYIEAELIPSGLEIIYKNGDALPTDESNLVYRAAKRLFKAAGREVPPIKLLLENNIPPARGLGSSSACIAGGLLLANALLENKFSRRELMYHAAALEGHSDNTTPALCGGFNVSVCEGEEIFYYNHHIRGDLKFLVMITDFQVKTAAARGALPKAYPIGDVSYSLPRAALFTAAIISGEYENLPCAVKDRLHQPYRGRLIDGYRQIREYLTGCGVLGTYISGSGPTLISLVRASDADGIFAGASGFLARAYPSWRALLLGADNEGALLI